MRACAHVKVGLHLCHRYHRWSLPYLLLFFISWASWPVRFQIILCPPYLVRVVELLTYPSMSWFTCIWRTQSQIVRLAGQELLPTESSLSRHTSLTWFQNLQIFQALWKSESGLFYVCGGRQVSAYSCRCAFVCWSGMNCGCCSLFSEQNFSQGPWDPWLSCLPCEPLATASVSPLLGLQAHNIAPSFLHCFWD